MLWLQLSGPKASVKGTGLNLKSFSQNIFLGQNRCTKMYLEIFSKIENPVLFKSQIYNNVVA